MVPSAVRWNKRFIWVHITAIDEVHQHSGAHTTRECNKQIPCGLQSCTTRAIRLEVDLWFQSFAKSEGNEWYKALSDDKKLSIKQKEAGWI